ncbi:unnamed protein product [Blumeria hordei]|uniref:phosphatidylinositol-3,4,5-trisphosphate 3-phosphatase n=1 Tax=Blumeria hordei TaxID=2867405 RepID=A0A383UT71_BLUHO|nr:unnamed protein product [Blumeria hordei]
MTSFLRQIVAGPRSRHSETNLDLCYVTPQIIATSGPSSRYPQRAYRNPLDQFVRFLDYNHGSDWAIWEFRAEGTGYQDEEVYERINHYPWPDHHPPPFKLVPTILADMRDWLEKKDKKKAGNDRVIVIHCKAGKGRSGTMACSYLISECGWQPEQALARFTERRMRPGFGQGVSIPSQLRWVGYADQWTKHGKNYIDRQVEILELRVWELRRGVKIQVEGYIEDGKKIKLFHRFTTNERTVEGDSSENENSSETVGITSKKKESSNILNKFSSSIKSSALSSPLARKNVTIYKPSSRVVLPTSDINIDFERRSKSSIGWTMVTSIAHVWFNCFFEGLGPDKIAQPRDNGVFEIEWDRMDGIKGSSRKGARAFDRLAVMWRVCDSVEKDSQGGTILSSQTQSTMSQIPVADSESTAKTRSSQDKELATRTESLVSNSSSPACKEEKHRIEHHKSDGPMTHSSSDKNLEDIESSLKKDLSTNASIENQSLCQNSQEKPPGLDSS